MNEIELSHKKGGRGREGRKEGGKKKERGDRSHIRSTHRINKSELLLSLVCCHPFSLLLIPHSLCCMVVICILPLYLFALFPLTHSGYFFPPPVRISPLFHSHPLTLLLFSLCLFVSYFRIFFDVSMDKSAWE